MNLRLFKSPVWDRRRGTGCSQEYKFTLVHDKLKSHYTVYIWGWDWTQIWLPTKVPQLWYIACMTKHTPTVTVQTALFSLFEWWSDEKLTHLQFCTVFTGFFFIPECLGFHLMVVAHSANCSLIVLLLHHADHNIRYPHRGLLEHGRPLPRFCRLSQNKMSAIACFHNINTGFL